jgi:hypothetical protein
MIRKPLFIVLPGLIALGLIFTFGRTPAANPDPNHTHADFAVWIDGKELDFAKDEFMSGLSTDADHDNEEGNRKYLHLHDGNGHVVHRHKPGLTLGEFFGTLGFETMQIQNDVAGWCWRTSGKDPCESGPMRLFVNGEEFLSKTGPLEYEFQDGDQLLITDATDSTDVEKELTALTDDACMYSKTCPWKGDPPTENCIADPTVPCVVQ